MLFNFQIETYCVINSPQNVEGCVAQSDFSKPVVYTGAATKELRFLLTMFSWEYLNLLV